MSGLTRAFRDLLWTVRSNPLLAAPPDYPRSDWFQRLPMPGPTDIPASEYPVPPDPHHFRLGQHFEALWQLWFRHVTDFKLLAANLQVQEGKQTIGEFDVLQRGPSGVEHWELAVKFYLGRHELRDPANWFGPNTADRLDTKLARLDTHQLRLAAHPAAAPLLAERDAMPGCARGIVKGRLFYPFAQFVRGSLPAPPRINRELLTGWWLPLTDIETLADQGSQAVCLDKQHWLSPILPVDDLPRHSLAELGEVLKERHLEQANHVALLDENGLEQSRGFLVTDQWLERTSTPAPRDQ